MELHDFDEFLLNDIVRYLQVDYFDGELNIVKKDSYQ